MARNLALKNTEPKPRQPPPKPKGSAERTSQAPVSGSGELEEQIRRRAYEIYLSRGTQDGHADDDWLQAEQEIRGITGGG
jgi:hypothetical protein